MTSELSSLLLVAAAAVTAPLLGSAVSRVVKIPIVVFEIVLGLVLGPSILGWVSVGHISETPAS